MALYPRRTIAGGLPALAALLLGDILGASTVDKVIVNKSKRELLLMSGAQVLKSYRVALGRSPVGAKKQQGDGRTPEGIYTISGRNPASAFHRALRISYPNPSDRGRAKRAAVNPGGDIMIHGLPNGQGSIGAAHRLTDWTEGCIAVTNDEIEEIWRLVPNGTTVEINPWP
jgi:murein L,D-transpeptidase YafK